MKVRYTVLILLLFFGLALGNVALALDTSQHEVLSKGTGTQTPSEGALIALKVPLFSPLFEQFPVALVNEDAITLGDLASALATVHEQQAAAEKQHGEIEYGMFLDRLINVSLVAQEAAKMGIDDLDAFKLTVQAYSASALAKLLLRDITKDVKEANPTAVEKLYKDRVVEYKIKSVFFEKEEDAKAMADEIKSGKNYDELAEKAVAEKRAKGHDVLDYTKPKDLAPDIAQAVSTLPTGSVSSVHKAQAGKTAGYIILKLEDRRYPENPEARKQAEKDVLAGAKAEAWEKYKESLLKDYVKIDEKFLNKLDLDSPKNNFPKMVKDPRAVAEIKGEKPITLGELITTLEEIHYHGLEQAAKSKKLNKDKRPALFKLISKRVIEKMVREKGLADRPEYQSGLREYKSEILFGLFIERVVSPDIKVTESDMKAYYEGHKKEYLYPDMMKMSSLAFRDKHYAEFALKALKKGADFNWVRGNTEGIVAASEEDPLTSLNSKILSLKSMPPGMAKAVSGAHAGEYRIYKGDEGLSYVLSIEEAIPARQQPYEEVKEEIAKQVYGEKFNQTMDDWFLKLRSAYTVRTYLEKTGK